MRRFLLIVACCAGFYLLLFQAFRVLTDVQALKTEYPKVIYDAKAKTDSIEVVKKRPAYWTNLGSVSKLAVAAIVLSEDWAFYQHNGFDWEQIQNSVETNLKKGKFARGGSTITQQVAKNVFLSNEKTIWRKVQEAVLAVRLERNLGKARILEIYLNIAEFGEGLYGIGPAARYYFKKSPAQLTAKEGAFLAMLLPSPKKYSVSYRKRVLTPYAASTVRSILGKLQATHRLSPEQYQAAVATPLSFEARQVAIPASAPEDEDVIDEESGDQGLPALAPAGAGEALERREEPRLAPEAPPAGEVPAEPAEAGTDAEADGAST
jgi:monofunctional glycosyltransferase